MNVKLWVIRRWIEKQQRFLYAAIDIDWNSLNNPNTVIKFATRHDATQGMKEHHIWEPDAEVAEVEFPPGTKPGATFK